MTFLLAASLALTTALALPPSLLRLPVRDVAPPTPTVTGETGWLRRGRWCWSLLAAFGAAAFVSGPLVLPAGLVAVAVVWVWAGRAEPASARRRRAAMERELPALVQLLVGALESGCDVADAARIVSASMPGPAARLLAVVPQRLSLGMSPEEAWRAVLELPELEPLGRTMVRAHRSGTSVTRALGVLADELERRATERVEQRARTVGVRAAVPLGLCLLPSFLLIGIVPLAVSLMQTLSVWR